MVQRLYFHDAATTVTGTLPATGSSQSATTPNVTAAGAGTNRSMTGTIGTLQVAPTLATLAQTATQSNFFRRFVSPPLAAQTSFSTTNATSSVTAYVTSNTNSGWGYRLETYIWRPGTGAKITTFFAMPNGYSGTGGATTTETSSGVAGGSIPSSSWLDGDVLIVEVWGVINQLKSTSYTWTLDYDGTTEPTGTAGAAATSAASYFDVGADLPLFVASSFMPDANKPILQAVNRAATY